MSSSDENECPLCMETLEVDDLNFYPCTCHYQICRFCWHRIRTDENGLCPACRKPYSENPVTFKPLSTEEIQKIKAQKKKRETQRKRCTSDNRKHLASLRVVQKNLVFAVGLAPRLADPEVLRKTDYFGKFGKIIKVVMNHSSSYAGGSQGPSASAYITYAKADDAIKAIHSVNNVTVDGRTIKTSLGTTKYCSMYLKHLPCNKADCMYLHEVGDEAASFTKEDMNAGKHTEYEKRLYEQMMMNQMNNPLQELLVKSKSSSNVPRGAAAEACPIPELPAPSSGTSLPSRPAPGTSPIEIPILPAKKSKKRGKDKRQSDNASSAQMAKSPKNKVIIVPAGSSSSLVAVASSTTSTTAGAKAKTRGTSAEESSGSDRGCSSSPPLLAHIVAGAAASGSSGVKSGESRGQTMAEVLMKREPSPAGSPGRMSDILVDDGTGASSGYASGSSASSSLQNSRYCPVAASSSSSSSSSASSTSVIPSTSNTVNEPQQQQQQLEEKRVEDVQKVFEQQQQMEEPQASSVQRAAAEKADGFARKVADYEMSLMRGDFDDLGFDPFAETQKAFAEILDTEEAENFSYAAAVPSSATPERTNGETGGLSIPPGFSSGFLLSQANVGRTEQPAPSYSSGLSEGGSKFLPFLLRNQHAHEAPPRSLPNDVEGRSMVDRLLTGLGGGSHFLDRQQTHASHFQPNMHFNQTHQQQQQQQQQMEDASRLNQRQYQPAEERQPALAFLRARGMSQDAPVSLPGFGNPRGDSSLYSWNEWEDSLKTLFPASSACTASTTTSSQSQQYSRPPPPGLSMPPGDGFGGIARSRFLEDLFGMKGQSDLPPVSSSSSTMGSDWQEIDPAIVATTRHAPGMAAAGSSSLPIPSRDSGRNSPPAWLLQSLEQLTNDSPPEASPPPVHQFLQFRRQLQQSNKPAMNSPGSIPPGFWPSSVSSQAPPGLAPPPGFSAGGGGIPHSFQSPFAPPVGGRNLPHDIFSADSRLQQRSALES